MNICFLMISTHSPNFKGNLRVDKARMLGAEPIGV